MLKKSEIIQFRKQFINIDNFINYQWGGYSSKPLSVLDEVCSWQKYEGMLPSSREIHTAVKEMKTAFRKKLAAFTGCREGELALTDHTTNGINLIGWGIRLSPGDRIILTKHEHPANILPWYNLARRFSCEVVFLDALHSDSMLLEQLETVLKAGHCKVISVSHVSRQTGFRLPVRELSAAARSYGVFSLIDGAQSIGNIPVDVREIGCDAYALCGHKWMLGPQGTGALYVRRDAMKKLLPSLIGSKSQMSYDLQGNVEWKPDMDRYEYGTSAVTLFAGWLKAMQLIEELGWDRVFSTIAAKAHSFKHRLRETFGNIVVTPMDQEKSSGIITIRLNKGTGVEFSAYAWERGSIQVSSLEQPDQVRICSHFVNTEDEQEQFFALLHAYLKRS
jgi:selenocysteine lyase/cysteine desulfurase